jgi:hypothetical protein
MIESSPTDIAAWYVTFFQIPFLIRVVEAKFDEEKTL